MQLDNGAKKIYFIADDSVFNDLTTESVQQLEYMEKFAAYTNTISCR